MRPRNTIVVLSACAVLACLCASAQTFEPIAGLMVIDSTGKVVGPVLSPGQNSARTLMDINGRKVIIDASKTRLSTNQWVNFFYESEDCEGTPYFSFGLAPGDMLFDYGFLCAGRTQQECPPGTDYLWGIVDTPVQITIRSITSGSGCNPYGPLETTGYEATMLLDFAQEFTPPFDLLSLPFGGTGTDCCDDVEECLDESPSYSHFKRCMGLGNPH